MKGGSREREWWVHSKNWGVGMNFGLMRRFCLGGGKVEIFHNPQQLQLCERLECLALDSCRAPKNFSLDLGCLKSLRVLILDGVGGMVEIVCTGKGDDDEGCLPKLRFVQLGGWDLKRIPFVRECDRLRWLAIVVYEEELVDFIHSGESKIFQKLKELETLYLSYVPVLPKLKIALALRILEVDFEDDWEERDAFEDDWEERDASEDNNLTTMVDVSPLGGLPMLSRVSLYLDEPLKVHGLVQLSRLTSFELKCSNSKLEGLDQLSQLTTLDLGFCKNLCQLPNLDVFPNLQEVCIGGCCSLEDFTCPLEKYEEIKYHTYHKCHQPFCNSQSCKVCVSRHRSTRCQMQVNCSICKHLKDYPRGCYMYRELAVWRSCLLCRLMC